MQKFLFEKNMYSKTAVIKSAYNFTDRAYIHLDSDNDYYIISLEKKEGTEEILESEFLNEMLAQSARHEIYIQTKDIRKIMFARAMATSIVIDKKDVNEESTTSFTEDEVLKDWFIENENS